QTDMQGIPHVPALRAILSKAGPQDLVFGHYGFATVAALTDRIAQFDQSLVSAIEPNQSRPRLIQIQHRHKS
ncbi:MAG: hypothetical protein WB630_02895, partial [Candidatus Acidiferrales bacterium]